MTALKNLTLPCPAHARRLAKSALALVAAACVSASTMAQSASAQSDLRVKRGREIVVTAGDPSSDTATGSLRLDSLVIPSGLSLARLSGRGTIATIGINRAGSGRAGEVITVEPAEIGRFCSRIIAANPRISLDCEPNSLSRGLAIPNDQYFGEQYGLQRIKAPAAWDVATGASDVIVAVVDSGVDYNHVELAGSILRNSAEIPNNGMDDDRNGFVDDYIGYDFVNNDGDALDDDGHGTRVAGVIGAAGNNGLGVSGVAWRASILPVKVLDAQGNGTIADLADGIKYAVQRGAKVINLSVGGYRPHAAERKAIREALVQDVVVVVAAGNESNNNDFRPSYPAGYRLDNIISVAGTMFDDSLMHMSNYGPTSVDIAAPGRLILTTAPNNYLDWGTGTSLAAPHVAGVIAVTRSINPLLSFAQIKNIILNSADQQPSLLGKILSGGRVNFARAAKIAVGSRAPIIPSPRRITFDSTRSSTRLRFFGTLVTPQNRAIPGVWMTLICGSSVVDRFKTGSNGGFATSMPIPASGTQCYVLDDQLIRSRTITVR